jgi:hypothetical protein
MNAEAGQRTGQGATPSLQELSLALRQLHKALLDAELENFPMARNAADRLALVIDHPSFAWLHPLSELIVEIDELADSDEGPPPSLRPRREAIERLLGPALASHDEFRSGHLEYLQLAPDVAIATGVIRRLLSRP